MVQPLARFRLPDLRGGYSGYLRAHGNLAPLRDDRAAPRPVRAGAVRTRLQGNDGRRNSAGERLAGIVLALTVHPLTLPLHARRKRRYPALLEHDPEKWKAVFPKRSC